MAILNVYFIKSKYQSYDAYGRLIYETPSAPIGAYCGFGVNFMLFRKGSLYSTYDENFELIRGNIPPSEIGDFFATGIDFMLFRKDDRFITYDKHLNKINYIHSLAAGEYVKVSGMHINFRKGKIQSNYDKFFNKVEEKFVKNVKSRSSVVRQVKLEL